MSAVRRRALAQRQAELLARSAALRASVPGQLRPWQPVLRVADRVQAAWAWLHHHPEWVAGAALTLVVLRPRRTLRWGLRLWSGLRLWRQLKDHLQTLR